MARKRKITRTFIKCTVLASVYNLQVKEAEELTYTTYFITDKNIEEQAESCLKNALPADKVLLEITHVEREEQRLGIPVEEFIRLAKEYEPEPTEEGDIDDDN